MPTYQFQVVEDYQSPDVRWTYLSDDDAAKRYGRLLIKDFKSHGGKFAAHTNMEIKDDQGRRVAILPFEDI
jgi:hypothetical protein